MSEQKPKYEFKSLVAKTPEEFAGLESFKAPERCTLVEFKTDELYSNCPITGQPDFSALEIDYMPHNLCVESKSLKLYLRTFAQTGIFGEELADVIAYNINLAIKPVWIRVTVKQGIRGGLQMNATSEMSSGDTGDTL